ncbi:MAG: prepilin-type N-terminal cleavage/methylation domain-containing protein [Alphaproteobacteria bacterium]|nr:MAG: prepilin-type N-terminal cleavage/methylation domain-containing protein [Alphaproteobacteria bacterium]
MARIYAAQNERAGEQGFTLVEMAVVLIIAGLMVGGVLGAQQMVQNARVNNVVTAVQSYQAAVADYQQKFGALPGDDDKANLHFGQNVSVTGAQHNGQIGTGSSFNSTESLSIGAAAGQQGESRLVWAHLRAAGLVKSAASPLEQPGNPFGGVYGIQYGAFSGAGALVGANALCMNGVSGSAALAIDSRLDDGNPVGGTLRAATAIGGTPPAEGYSTDETYVVCTTL